jgi:hypothetical protein
MIQLLQAELVSRLRGSWLEALAATDRRDQEVQWRQPRMPALFDQSLRGLVLQPNLDELDLIRIVLAVVSAQAALAIFDFNHGVLLRLK